MAIWGAVSWGCNKVEEGNSRQWLDFMCILHLWHWNCHGNVKSEVQELKCFDGQSRGFWCHSSISIRGCNICSNAVNQMIVFLIFTCKTVNLYLKYFCRSWKIWTPLLCCIAHCALFEDILKKEPEAYLKISWENKMPISYEIKWCENIHYFL